MTQRKNSSVRSGVNELLSQSNVEGRNLIGDLTAVAVCAGLALAFVVSVTMLVRYEMISQTGGVLARLSAEIER